MYGFEKEEILLLHIGELRISNESDFNDLKKLILDITRESKSNFLSVLDASETDGLNTITEIKNAIWRKEYEDETISIRAVAEYPYVDNFYLEEFTMHYYNKLYQPSSNTVRISFFFENDNGSGDTESEIMGNIILIPTDALNHIGKVNFNPKFLLPQGTFHCITSEFKEHILGHRYLFDYFPHARQYGVVSCAHISLWELTQYCGNNWSKHSQKSCSEIISAVSNINAKTHISPPELTINQICHVLSNFNYKPIFKPFVHDDYQESINEIAAYIDSGIPIILIDGQFNHAGVSVGYSKSKVKDQLDGELNQDSFNDLECLFSSNDDQIKIHNDKDTCNYLIVNDDNDFPYKLISESTDLSREYHEYNLNLSLYN